MSVGRLGRGLGSLIPTKRGPSATADNSPAAGSQRIATDMIRVNRHQPRSAIERGSLVELIESIREHGILQPLIVTPSKNGGYELIAGERRFQSAKALGLTTIPAIIREATEQQQLELALVENLQRKNLNPLEEAEAFQKLSDEFNLTQEEIAKKVGKSRSHVANTLRMLTLPQEAKKAILDNTITEGHAKVLLSIESPSEQLVLLKRIIAQGLSVRAGEALASMHRRARGHRNSAEDPNLRSHEAALQRALGTRVTIDRHGQRGKISIEFYSAEEFAALLRRLTKPS